MGRRTLTALVAIAISGMALSAGAVASAHRPHRVLLSGVALTCRQRVAHISLTGQRHGVRRSGCPRTMRARGTTPAHRAHAARARRHRRPVRRTESTTPGTTATASATSVSSGLIVGLNGDTEGWGGASAAGHLDQVTSGTGTRWLREEFKWNLIEPSPGQFDFSYYDHYMLLAAQRGLHVLPVLYETPAWAGATPNTIPSDTAAWSQYVAAVIGRYGANGSFWNENPSLRGSAIHTWEIWNEPYLSSGNNGDYDPGRYAQLIKAAAIAGRTADANARFLLAAEMQSARDANGSWQWWADALYLAVPDLNNYFDGVAVHDYGSDTSALKPMIAGRAYDNYGHVRRIEDLRREFVSHNANKPFWITEAGWSTCNDSASCVTPAQQATNLAALFALMHTSWSGWVQGAFIYRYGDGSDPSSDQGGYGLTNLDGSAKPALAIFQTQAADSAT